MTSWSPPASQRKSLSRMRFLLAVKMFELGRLSLGKAAELCGMQKMNFMGEMGRMGIPVINLDNDQIRQEIENG